MNEQPSQTTTAVQVATTTSACPHPEAVGERWGDPISEERQAELQGYLDRWAAETDHGERKGPYDGARSAVAVLHAIRLTGADVFWLTAARVVHGELPGLGPHLEGANLSGAHLEGANLAHVYLQGAFLYDAHLEQSHLFGANLGKAGLFEAHLEGASLEYADVKDANLHDAHLNGAKLDGANLEQTNLIGTHFEGASLVSAHLEGAKLENAHLEGARLVGAWFDNKTYMSGISLDRKTMLGDIQWGGVGSVNLTRINWKQVPTLGDEQGVGLLAKASEHEGVVRAYRQIATQLRAQGMSEVADRFAYRAQVLQRRVLLRRLRLPQYLGSRFLDLISGYGYRPLRSFITYVLVVLAFAAAYLTLGGANGQSLSWNEAIVISMTAFHGRGFFSAVFQPGDIQAAVAAVEAFIGLLIEIVFIATFTQRFFAR